MKRGWTELRAVRNKAQVWIHQAIDDIREKLPFPLLSLDSDNGLEFINAHLLRYCEGHQITFTRSRPYKKKTAATWNRRTTPRLGSMWGTSATTPTNSFSSLPGSTRCYAHTSTSFSPGPGFGRRCARVPW